MVGVDMAGRNMNAEQTSPMLREQRLTGTHGEPQRTPTLSFHGRPATQRLSIHPVTHRIHSPTGSHHE